MAWKEGRKDLTGQVFGRLTVIGFSHTNNKRLSYWKVTCSCGAQKVVRGASLIAGEIRSCGCLQKESTIKQRLDLTGEVFGRLTVLEFSHINKNRQTMWRVQCSCGNQKIMGGSTIKNGYILSCGCLNHELESKGCYKNLVGQRFGRLLVMERTERRQGRQIIWRCLCSCGKETFVRTGSLTSLWTQSCGCLNRDVITTHGKSKTKEYNTARNRIRYERKRNQDGEWTILMEICLRDYQPACVVCGSTDSLSVDHVVPVAKGGGLKPGTACILCKRHNSMKGAKSLDQLPLDMANKIRDAAESFRVAWSGGF
jgi:5-methylcytosine-specific restriction endonuclease McrA